MRWDLIITLCSSIFLKCTFSSQVEDTRAETSDTNAVEVPDSDYAHYIYNADLGDSVLSYQYINLWDFDNDGVNDLVSFIGNGGAHQYFSLEIQLSSELKAHSYPSFYIDMPYLISDSAIEIGTYYPQFLVRDFDRDTIPEIYLNLENNFASIPKALYDQGVDSKQVLIDFEMNELKIKNYQ